jgi:hypothetical protein
MFLPMNYKLITTYALHAHSRYENVTMQQELPTARENITVHAFINSHTKEHSLQLRGFYQQ